MHICDSFMRDDAQVTVKEATVLKGQKRVTFSDEHSYVTVVLPEAVLDRLCIALADRVPAVLDKLSIGVRDESGV